MKRTYSYAFLWSMLLLPDFSFSQNLEKIGKEDMIKITGGVNFNSVIYHTDGISRRDPFTWFASGNLNISIIDFNIPLQYSYTNKRGKFTQPFNQFSISPYYKWIKTQFGYTSVNYSSYTLAGHVFLGGAVDLSPKSFRFSMMYGRLKKATTETELTSENPQLSFKRMGWGFKSGYEKSGNSFFLTVFSAQDDPLSLAYLPVNASVVPLQNMVAAASGKIKINASLSAEGEYALSMINKNKDYNSVRPFINRYFLPDLAEFIPEASNFSAYKASVNYAFKKFNLRAQYEHVDPEYQSLGTYFMNNDLENYTLSSSFQFLKGKMSLSVNSGLQLNNLNDQKLSTTKRWVGAANINYSPSEKWNLSSSFSNFTTFTRNRPQADPYFTNFFDTLNFYQVSRSANFSVSHPFGSKTVKQTLALTGSWAESSQQTGNITDPGYLGIINATNPNTVINGNFSWATSFIPKKISFSTGVNSNYSETQGGTTLFIGPNASFSKTLSKTGVRLSAGSAYNITFNNSIANGSLLNHRISLNHSTKNKEKNFGRITSGISVVYLQKLNNSGKVILNECTGTINLNYNF